MDLRISVSRFRNTLINNDYCWQIWTSGRKPRVYWERRGNRTAITKVLDEYGVGRRPDTLINCPLQQQMTDIGWVELGRI